MEVVKPSWLQHAPGTTCTLPIHLTLHIVGAGGRKSQQDSSIFSIDYCHQSMASDGGGRLATAGLDCTIRIWSMTGADKDTADNRVGVDGAHPERKNEQDEETVTVVNKLTPATHLVAVMSRHTGIETGPDPAKASRSLTILFLRCGIVCPLVSAGDHNDCPQDSSWPQPTMAIPSQWC